MVAAVVEASASRGLGRGPAGRWLMKVPRLTAAAGVVIDRARRGVGIAGDTDTSSADG